MESGRIQSAILYSQAILALDKNAYDWAASTKVTCKTLEESGEYALVAEEY
jgi:hypothetical protein